ncbi:UDP-glycosyltransferase UGT5-like [Leguminivora glycinivorella]|uniref:UDP-glycosyltransferase UGT5-like n=1 Tax=Leguminivora glycinivorella TaxID=1035111 RepID=UPI00200E3E4E|nr:UDP-glycosyltransferase UGT5-like [Leguminivora glycinivorella]
MDNSVFLFILSSAVCCQCANILYVIPFTSKSHYIMLRPIGLELARRGHNVTVFTAFKETDHAPTYHQIMADDKKIWDVSEGGRPNVFTMVDISEELFYEKILWGGGLASTEVALSSQQIQDFLKQDHKFDLVISEMFFQEATYVLAHKYNAPLALVTTFGNCMRNNIIMRNPLQLATVINEFVAIKEPRSFLGRLRNFYFAAYEYFWYKVWYIRKQEELAKKYIRNMPEPVPSLEELQRNASLFLMNSHFSFDTPAAYLPNLVEIGGIHLTHKFDPLPKDLADILNKSTQGVIYMSFGSNVHSSELPLDKKKAFLNVFRRLKYTVLWKWEEKSLEGKPDNLIIRKWLPQKAILAHPNVKVFISHGGLIGTQEAVFHGVPIIGVPIYADQYNNLLQAQEAGMGRILQYHDINEENLEAALREVCEKDSYKIKAKELSARFQDRPFTALQTAMYWIEYVIRNNGADYMKNPARNLSCVEYHMVDVFAFFLAIAVAFIFVVVKIIKVIKYFVTKETTVKKKSKRS